MKNSLVASILLLVTIVISGCGSVVKPADPAAVIESFFDAFNAGDIDGAMDLVADDVTYVTNKLYSGGAQIRELIQVQVDNNAHVELSDIQVEGDTVTWNLISTSDLDEFELSAEAVVQEGLIVFVRDSCAPDWPEKPTN